VADEWAWSPLAVSGVPRGSDDKEAEELSTPCMIMDVDLKLL
jgi:hypothetical protein